VAISLYSNFSNRVLDDSMEYGITILSMSYWGVVIPFLFLFDNIVGVNGSSYAAVVLNLLRGIPTITILLL
jgi:hypothetical protein